eukprot:1144265-Pelagomonas_calceolata.AAC.1
MPALLTLQVACYEPTQHFLSHEDAFPMPLARSNQFNRHATVLIYLNSVEKVIVYTMCVLRRSGGEQGTTAQRM